MTICNTKPNLFQKNFFLILYFLSLYFAAPTFYCPYIPTLSIKDNVHNSRLDWAGNDPKLIYSSEKRALLLQEQVSALQSQVSTLQNENDLMRTSGNNLLKEKTVLKEHNLAFADMIANLNGYITQLRTSPPKTKDVNI